MSNEGFLEIIGARASDRVDLFLTTAQRMGAPLINIEKDFWVCWPLNALYHRLAENGPRLLFKGGTSLSKAYGLINRFSEDIDVTVFRDDLGHPATPAELAALSNKKRKATLDAIAEDCRTYITADMLVSVSELLLEDTKGEGRVSRREHQPYGAGRSPQAPYDVLRKGRIIRVACSQANNTHFQKGTHCGQLTRAH